jgi:hypothetical protein
MTALDRRLAHAYLSVLALSVAGLSYVDVLKKRRVTKRTHRLLRSR